MYFKPGKARSISNLVPGGLYYDKLLNNKSTPDDAKFYLFPYGGMYYSKYILEYNKKSKFKSVSILYVTIYFKLILQILKQIKAIGESV